MTSPLVCLLTDFGLKDNYVGAMKGVLLSGVPGLQIVDVTHDVPPQNIPYGAFQLVSCYKNFPDGSVFISVVDPGVGGKRKVILAQAASRFFIGPDNGLLSWVLKEAKPDIVVDISDSVSDKGKVSQTFHGRDLMAPAAVRLLKGEKPDSIGVAVSSWVDLPFPAVEKQGSQWVAQVVAVDRFGNVITNIKTKEISNLSEHAKVWFDLGKNKAPIRGLVESYESVEKGKLLAIGGSSGFVELAVRDGSAASAIGLHQGDKITISLKT